MAIKLPKENQSNFETTPEGTHVAVCYRVIDQGTQDVTFSGQTKQQRKVMISWELTDERMSDDKPFTVHKTMTLSADKKSTLRKFLESWRGLAFTEKDFGNFDLGTLIGKGALLGIVHDTTETGTYANLTTIMKLPKGTKTTEPENETVYFSLDEFDGEIFAGLSESLREKIAKSPEYKEAVKSGKAASAVPTIESVQAGLAAIDSLPDHEGEDFHV